MSYSVVVRDPNSWCESTGIHEERANCGHNHKTIAAADACMERLCKPYHDGSVPAPWYHTHVEDNATHRTVTD